MAYMIAWSIYLLMAALLVFGYERYVAGYVGPRQLRIFLRALLAIMLFTPGFISAGAVYVVPACVGVMFNLLAHSGVGMLKASLPLLFVSSVVFAVLFCREARRSKELQEQLQP